ncbi:MAG: hypothetical protein H0X65_11265 [Gemmatimonadetes bacterium]|nr:hypothetical protein [Gemmatimonadota bacterium]
MQKITKFALVGATVAALGAINVSSADAQVCIGFPTFGGQAAAAVTTSFPAGGNSLGGEFGYNAVGPLSLFGGASVRQFNEEGVADVTSAGGGIALEVGAIDAALPAGISACPVVAVRFPNIDDTDTYRIPVGLGIGTTLGMNGALSLSPYVIPQLSFLRSPGVTGRDFAVEAGALLNLGRVLYLGATVNRLFLDEEESIFGLKVGATF